MTPHEAYKIIRKKQPHKQLRECVDFGEFYAFSFSDKEGDLGGAYETVNKESGEISFFNPISNLKLLKVAKQVDVNTI